MKAPTTAPTSLQSQRTLAAALRGLALALAMALFPPCPAQEFKPGTKERIGVYDSRAVAIAYAGSALQQEEMQTLMRQLEKARKAGDTNAVTRLKAQGQAWQNTLHQQGFGTAPVDNILEHISDQIPAIRQEAAVSSLISKWDQPGLDRHPGAQRIDVTMKLVDALHPTQAQRKRALEIQRKPPLKTRE